MGRDSLHKIAVCENFTRYRGGWRWPAIKEDREAGYKPFCVVGCAGTVNTGALDNLTGIAEFCKSEVACGFMSMPPLGPSAASVDVLAAPESRGLSFQIPQAAFDFHKWMYVQYDAGCVLVRNSELHRKAFTMRPAYLQTSQRGLAGGESKVVHGSWARIVTQTSVH